MRATASIYELSVPLSTGLQVTIASGYSSPSSVVADPSGALFVVDQGNQKVWRIPNVSGTFTTGSAINVTGQLNASGNPIVADPYGVTLDPSGNLYVTDSMNGAAYEVARTSSTQSAGVVSPNSSGNPLTYFLESEGSAALTLGNPYEAATGDTTQFTALNGENNACTNSENMATGSSCDVQAEFAPTAYGDYTLTFDLSSNATNATNQAISFTGTAGQTATTTTAFDADVAQRTSFVRSGSDVYGVRIQRNRNSGRRSEPVSRRDYGADSYSDEPGHRVVYSRCRNFNRRQPHGGSRVRGRSFRHHHLLGQHLLRPHRQRDCRPHFHNPELCHGVYRTCQPARRNLARLHGHGELSFCRRSHRAGDLQDHRLQRNHRHWNRRPPARKRRDVRGYLHLCQQQSPANSAPYDVESVTATYSGDQNFRVPVHRAHRSTFRPPAGAR